jgi:sterol desaturase/sphingolipid hydroxylase (fatty acid hydroxylase superfamily)
VSIPERIFSVSVFPLVLGGVMAWAAWSMHAGVNPEAAIAGPTFVPALLLIGLERIFPYHRSWLGWQSDVRTDLAHLVSVGFAAGLMRPLVTLAIAPAAIWLAGRLGVGPWPHGWHWVPQLALALVVAELPKYWLHRLMHEHDFLWRLHATHHSVPRLYWLNAARFHPLDIALDTAVGLTPLILLGCGPEVLAFFLLLSAVHGYFQHSNLKLRLGPLNYIFSMAELHRWHHSRTVFEANHNYGQNVIFWDLVFRTFYWPQDREPPEDTGLAGLPNFPQDWWGQQLSPFRWKQIKASQPHE